MLRAVNYFERKGIFVNINTILTEHVPAIISWGIGFAPKLIIAILIFIIGRMIVRKLSGATVTASQKVPNLDLTIAKFFGSVVAIFGMFGVMVAALSALGVPLGFIATIIGAMVVALGFALKDSLGDLASGVMLAFFRPYVVGDEVEINGESGVVKSLDVFSTTLETVDGVEILVGNGGAFGNKIKNYSNFGDLRLDMDFGVSYDADLDKAIAVITGAAAKDERIIDTPHGPWAKVTGLGDSAVNIQLRVWCKAGDRRAINADMSQRVKAALDKAGIDIPYEHCMIIPMKAK